MRFSMFIKPLVALSIMVGVVYLGALNTPLNLKVIYTPFGNYIVSAPARLKKSGTYYLTRSIEMRKKPGAAIIIGADDITLNLNGHGVYGPGKTDTKNDGIYGENRYHVQVQNGFVAGFKYGVRFKNPVDGPLSNIRVSGLTLHDNFYRGIEILGNGSVIENNKVFNTGGTALTPDAYCMGIEVVGPRHIIRGNKVLETYPVRVGEGVGISLRNACLHCQVTGNTIQNSKYPPQGRSFGIWVGGEKKDIRVSGNFIQHYTYGIAPVAAPDSAVKITQNTFDTIDCTPLDTASIYASHNNPNRNVYQNETPGCSDLPEHFMSQALQGEMLAQYRLAMSFEDIDKRLYWLNKAAMQGHLASRDLMIYIKQLRAGGKL